MADSGRNKDKKKKGDSTHRDCAWCRAQESLLHSIPKHYACARCKITFYCSVQCQKRHWKEGGHKRHCVAPEQRKVVATIKTSAVLVTGSEAIAAPEGSPKNCCGDKILNTHYAESTLDEKEEECAICLDSFAAEKGIRLPCSHVYHLDCVEKLREFGIQQVCPLCRADLPPGPGQLHDEAARRWIVLHRKYGRGTQGAWCAVVDSADAREMDAVLRLFQKAADQGHAEALFILGQIYHFGQGVAQDASMAVTWYEKAANQGNLKACFNVGFAFHKGQGVPQNYSTAMQYWKKAANLGHKMAHVNIGIAYAEGLGVPENFGMAVEWYRKAAMMGVAEAQHCLGLHHDYGKGVPEDTTMAAEWYRRAADQGCAKAQGSLGCAYFHGRGVARSCEVALEWWQKAANQGDADAQFHVGLMHAQGQGTPRDDSEALRWFHRAQSQGSESAKEAIGVILRTRRDQKSVQDSSE
jgi:TPR repeat protein